MVPKMVTDTAVKLLALLHPVAVYILKRVYPSR
jgi:hypothetical protein